MNAPEWEYRPAPDLERSVAERLKGFPREPSMWVYATRSLAALALRGWLRAYHRYRIEGRERLPREGSFVLVANHASHLDAPCLLSALPLGTLHRAFPAAAADYFFSSLPRSAFAGVFINALPFERKGGGAESLEICAHLLETPGNVLVLFPEGTRTTTGELGRFRSGIGRLVAGTGVPVVPAWLEGAGRAWPKGRAIPAPRPLALRIGTPLRFEDRARDRDGAQSVCEDLQRAVAALAPGGFVTDRGA